MTIAYDMALTISMKPYLLAAMKATFGDECAICGMWQQSYEIDHKRYNEGITMYDLQLLCSNCHLSKTEVSQEGYLSRTPHCPTCTCYDCNE